MRTVKQVEGIAGALAYRAFTGDEVGQIEAQLDCQPAEALDAAR